MIPPVAILRQAILIISLLAVGCAGSEPETATITVFAAASLGPAFEQIADEFEAANPQLAVRLNLSGSQRLRTQLELGAGADVFASADTVQMDRAVEAGLVDGKPLLFASTEMAVIASIQRGANVTHLKDLGEPGVTVVLAHPAVPAGAYSRALLDKLAAAGPEFGPDFSRRVLSNVVSEETSVKNVEQKVVLGAVDAGIVYSPGAVTAVVSGSVRRLPIPEGYNVRASYPIAVLKDSRNLEWAREFVSFVVSAPGQEVLASHGFGGP